MAAVAAFHLTNLQDRVLIELADMNLVGTALQYMNLQLTCDWHRSAKAWPRYYPPSARRMSDTTILLVSPIMESLGSRSA